jgi:hypothetical protein
LKKFLEKVTSQRNAKPASFAKGLSNFMLLKTLSHSRCLFARKNRGKVLRENISQFQRPAGIKTTGDNFSSGENGNMIAQCITGFMLKQNFPVFLSANEILATAAEKYDCQVVCSFLFFVKSIQRAKVEIFLKFFLTQAVEFFHLQLIDIPQTQIDISLGRKFHSHIKNIFKKAFPIGCWNIFFCIM